MVIVYDFQDITCNHRQYKLYYIALYGRMKHSQELTTGVKSEEEGVGEGKNCLSHNSDRRRPHHCAEDNCGHKRKLFIRNGGGYFHSILNLRGFIQHKWKSNLHFCYRHR